MTLAAEHFPSDANAMQDDSVNAMWPPAAGVGMYDDPVDAMRPPAAWVGVYDDPVDGVVNYFGFGRHSGGAAERGEGGNDKHQLSHFESPAQ